MLVSLRKWLIFFQYKPVPHWLRSKWNKNVGLAANTGEEINFKTAPSVTPGQHSPGPQTTMESDRRRPFSSHLRRRPPAHVGEVSLGAGAGARGGGGERPTSPHYPAPALKPPSGASSVSAAGCRGWSRGVCGGLPQLPAADLRGGRKEPVSRSEAAAGCPALPGRAAVPWNEPSPSSERCRLPPPPSLRKRLLPENRPVGRAAPGRRGPRLPPAGGSGQGPEREGGDGLRSCAFPRARRFAFCPWIKSITELPQPLESHLLPVGWHRSGKQPSLPTVVFLPAADCLSLFVLLCLRLTLLECFFSSIKKPFSNLFLFLRGFLTRSDHATLPNSYL